MGEVIPLFKDGGATVPTASGDVSADALADALAGIEHTMSVVVSTYDDCTRSDASPGDTAVFWQAMASLKREVSLLPDAPGG